MTFARCNQNVHSEAHKDITQARFLPTHLLHFSWLLFIAYAHEGTLRPSRAHCVLPLRYTLAKQNVHENARQSYKACQRSAPDASVLSITIARCMCTSTAYVGLSCDRLPSETKKRSDPKATSSRHSRPEIPETRCERDQ